METLDLNPKQILNECASSDTDFNLENNINLNIDNDNEFVIDDGFVLDNDFDLKNDINLNIDNDDFELEVDNFDFDPIFYDSSTDDDNNEISNNNEIVTYNEISNNNENDIINIKETYENKYLEQFKLFNELRQYVDEKVRELKKKEEEIIQKNTSEKLELFTKLENEKQKLETTKENLANELSRLLEEESNLNKPDYESEVFKILDTDIYSENIKKFDGDNEEIIKKIKIKQKEKNEIDAIKNEHYQEYQNSLLQNKINLKGNKIVWEQRNEYLKNKLLETEKDYNTFEKKWLQYIDLYKNNKSDIEETIQVLKEDIDNIDSNTKLERRKTIKIIKQWEEEKEENRHKIKIYSEKISGLEKEKNMLITKQSEWMQSVKNENLIISEKIKVEITSNEVELKVISDQILELEKKIKNIEFEIKKGRIDLDNIGWKLRQELGEANDQKSNISLKYNNLLLEFKTQQFNYNKIIANDPFKMEINTINLTIRNLESDIQNIKRMTEINAQKNKEYCTNLKNKIVNVRFEIKNEIDTLEKLEREYINQELKYKDDKKNKQTKIKDIELELSEHKKYLEDLILQNNNDNQSAKEIYNNVTVDLDNKIKVINYDINHLKYQSNSILKSKDEYIRKRNQIGNDKKRRLDDINKSKIKIHQEIKNIDEEKNKWRNEFIKYNNRCDYLDSQENTLKINTLKEINELYKSRNNAELELNNNYFIQN